ncbi:MAG: M14 family zinc carboxypeptidase [Gemmatimonadota bacterium]
MTAYDAAVPRPEDVLGRRVGEAHSRPEEIVRYFDAVAAASERVLVRRHGRTHEGRDLLHAIVARPEVLARLEEVRSANLRLSLAPDGVSDEEFASMPGVVFLAYGVHGNEASGGEAALLALYHLAAGRGPAVESVLDRLVVVLDPMLNPDGRDRFVDWVNGNRGATQAGDPQGREHEAPWPGGRGNHYWLDLNRDWLAATQPETRDRLALYHAWRPQLLGDFHEMGSGSTFFFQPGVPERVNPATPERNRELTARIAAFHAAAFDRLGQPYFSGETFDDFFYGKGSTYPDINGAVGILFEQASSRALEVETERGTLRYPRTIRNQFAATLSTLEAAVALRAELLAHQREFFATAVSTPGAWLIDGRRSPERGRELVALLGRHGIGVHGLARPLVADGTRFEPDSAWIVPLDQPQGRLLDALMRRTAEFPDSVFYDVSAWTLPLAFDLDVARLPRYEARSVGPAVAAAAAPTPAMPELDAIGWALPWGEPSSARALARWLRSGLEARVVGRAFTARTAEGLQAWPAGSVLLSASSRGERRETDLAAVLDSVVRVDRAAPIAVTSTSTPEGPDLGGPSAHVLGPPRVVLLTGAGISSSRAGEVWHLLSSETRLPVTLLDAERAGRVDLGRYDVIVVPGGVPGTEATSAIAERVRRGARLVALGSAVRWAVGEGWLELEERPFDVDSIAATRPWSDLGLVRAAHDVPGTILEVRLDATHPLAWGIGAALPVMVSNGPFYEPSKAPGTTVGRFADPPRLSGWLSDARDRQAAGGAAVTVARLERGRVVAIHADPAFRASWPGSARLLWNAVLFAPIY